MIFAVALAVATYFNHSFLEANRFSSTVAAKISGALRLWKETISQTKAFLEFEAAGHAMINFQLTSDPARGQLHKLSKEQCKIPDSNE
jgi:hypothetical protein